MGARAVVVKRTGEAAAKSVSSARAVAEAARGREVGGADGRGAAGFDG